MNFEYELDLPCPPKIAFEALSTSSGIAGWWCKSNEIREVDGEKQISLNFGAVSQLMSVQREKSPTELQWLVLQCTLHEWPGTRIIFNIVPMANGGAHLKLVHEGLSPQLECFGSCSAGWQYFMGSLAQYVETGHGTPY